MGKNIIKEIIIVLLLALAIILVLGVILYEYLPTNKIVPEAVSYTTPEDVRAELEKDSNVDETEVVVTYEIDATDLNNYKKIQEYVPGKKNPFSSVQTIINDTNTTVNNDGAEGEKQSTTNSNENTGYIPDKGTK